jgi:hypothetical protein
MTEPRKLARCIIHLKVYIQEEANSLNVRAQSSTLSRRLGRRESSGQLDHAQVGRPIALADPISVTGATVLARRERSRRPDKRHAVPVLVQQQSAAVVLERKLQIRLVVAWVEFAGLDDRLGGARLRDGALGALDVEAQRVDGLAVQLAGRHVVDTPDPVAICGERGRCLREVLAGGDGGGGAEAGGGQEGSCEVLVLHFGGCAGGIICGWFGWMSGMRVRFDAVFESAASTSLYKEGHIQQYIDVVVYSPSALIG